MKYWLLFILLLISPAIFAATVEVRVAAGTDDVLHDAGIDFLLTETQSEFSTDDDNGYRFLALTIPNGATIDSAWVKVTSNETTSGAVTMTISGEDVDDAATFSTEGDFTGRTHTTATVSWVIDVGDQWTSGVTDNYQSPDIKTIIQEIVDRGGWVSGQDMGIFINYASGAGNRAAYTYEGGGGGGVKAMLLHVGYTTATCTPGDGVHIDTVQASTDDGGLGFTEAWSNTATSQSIGLGAFPSEYESGVLFQSIFVDSGQVLDSALLSLEASTTQTGTTVNVRINGNDVDSAVTFTSFAEWNGRARTSARVDSTSLQDWTADSTYRFDVTSIAQEIVDRGGWKCGNAMAFLLNYSVSTVDRNYKTFDNSQAVAPKLLMYWGSATTGAQIIICD